jgi:DNA polymerase I-like protein with 3'-5' exonuclease and polymerase domains
MQMNSILVDARNFDEVAPRITEAMSGASFVGLDCETQDDARHEGLNQLCGYDPVTRKKSAQKKLVFDMRRVVMTGFSVYPDGHDTAYYINLAHADTENRLPLEKAYRILDALPEGAYWIAHNAPFELTAFANAIDYPLERIICTLQMAVSAYGPDEYSMARFSTAGRGGIAALIPALIRESMTYEAGGEMTPALADLVYKIIAKESDAAHSWNGYVKAMAYGYGLKQAVKSFFNYDMTTFEQVLGGRAHMGQLTGEEVVAYGADDAYWALRLFQHLLTIMPATTVETFFSQENPMVHIFSAIWRGGMRVNSEAVYERRTTERQGAADVFRRMKAVVQQLLPFPEDPHAGLMENDPKWYAKNWQKYRQQIIAWASSEDSDDAYMQVSQVRGPVTNAWRAEVGDPESTGPNFSHYMPIRTLIYDLLGQKIIKSDGKTQSDGEARGRLKDKLKDPVARELIDCINEIAGVEQRMKLYITPYTRLMDPETGFMYPVVSSKLAARRLAASDPNPMQLAKRGESTYVRGFFEADNDEHVIVSIDWSGIELVEIGEFSGDPEFIKAFGQIPHQDLHGGAAADILAADVPGLTEEIFKDLRNHEKAETFMERWNGCFENEQRLFTNLKGEPLNPQKGYKYWRTEVGKGANFNYWYSGFLATIGERMGWSMDKTGDATERYRQRFSVAESWRTNLIDEVRRNGLVTLPDGHTRTRFEATPVFRELFLDRFQLPDLPGGYNAVMEWVCRKIQKRAENQTVNAYIQGSCATIMKRSVIRIHNELKARVWDHRIARFLIPIHDETVWSVHRSYVVPFITMARGIMIDHPDMFTKCKLDASPAVGLTFEPWHPEKAPFGQIELYELPKLAVVPDTSVNNRASDDETEAVVDYLFHMKKAA